VAEIRYQLRYETTWWQDVCRIEPDPIKWDDLVGGVEDILERTPEIIERRTRRGSYVMATADYPHLRMSPMLVLFSIERPAAPGELAVPPGGLLSLKHVITEADVRMGLVYEYGDDLAAECQELRELLLRRER
jgi:hypothetical protein